MYFKRWTGQILKTNNQAVSKLPKKEEKDENLVEKVRRLNIRINFALCCEDILMQCKQKTSKSFSLQKNIDKTGEDFISRSVDRLYERIDDNLRNVLAHNILDAYYKTLYTIKWATGSNSHVQNISPDIFEEYYSKIIDMKDSFKKKVIQERSNNNYRQQSIVSLFSSVLKKTEDLIYQATIKAKLEACKHENITEYKYCASSSDSSCDDCKQNHGKIFSFIDASEGENLPPMHPKCRCSIIPVYESNQSARENTIPDKIQDTDGDIDQNINRYEYAKWYDRVFQKIREMSDRNAYLETYNNNYTYVNINGKPYKFYPDLTQNIAILPNGDIINGDKLTENDKELLNIMKLRDSTTNFQEKETYMLEGIKLVEKETSRYIDFFKSYDFYTLNEDVTDRLNNFMATAVQENEDLINEWVLPRVVDFFGLVKPGAKYDLKVQPEWQQSMYIYDGEIVDQDTLGNINYGYLGESLFSNQELLLGGAGFAQILVGTSDMSFISTYFDDPRDQIRVIQGIDKYQEHNSNN